MYFDPKKVGIGLTRKSSIANNIASVVLSF